MLTLFEKNHIKTFTYLMAITMQLESASVLERLVARVTRQGVEVKE